MRIGIRAARFAAVALAVATSVAVPSASSADEGPLCGVVDPVDPLLGCDQEPPPPGGAEDVAPSESGEPGPPAGSPDAPPAQPATSPAAVTATQGSPPAAVPAKPQYLANQLLVEFERGVTKAQIAGVLKRAGVVVEETIGELGVVVVRVPPARRSRALAELRASKLVETAERDAKVYPLETQPNDGVWPEQWGLQLMGLPAAWDLSRGSNTLVVAVVDTGVEANHPDLAGAVLPGVDLVNGDGDAADDHGHGTTVAGILAARTNNGQGEAGVCWTCSILPIKVLDANGSGNMADLASGIVEAVDRGARVINLSVGGPAGSETLEKAVSHALGKGAVVIAAAGNNGVSTPFYPAAYPGVISVAATDDLDELYPWSNFGPWVRVAAPGCNVGTVLGGGYDHVCGTSMASPLVAGVAALALSARSTASRAEIENALLASGAATPSGLRRVNAVGTLSALGITAAPRSAPGTARSSLTLRGELTPRAPTRAYPIATGEGRLIATLTFTSKRPLTLSLVGANGALLARVTGKSPLKLLQLAPAGALRVLVHAGARASFVLKLSFAAPPAGA